MKSFIFKYIIFLSLVICGCRKTNYANFHQSESEYYKQKKFDDFKISSNNQPIRYNELQKRLKNQLSTLNFELKSKLSPMYLKKSHNQIKHKIVQNKENNPTFREKHKSPKKARNYEKIGNTAGILGLSSVALYFLSSFLGAALPYVLALTFLASIVGLVLGIISIKKVEKKKKLMPLLGILIGSIAIVTLIFWTILIILLIELFTNYP
jgi:hypothetical protein